MKPASLEAVAVHNELWELCRAQQRAAHQCAVLLARVADNGYHNELGYASIVDYAVRALDLTERKARDLLRLGRRLAEFPAMNEAFAEGRLPWTKARELLAVARPDNEQAWVDRACALTNRELELQVRASTGDPPTHVGPPDRPARGRLVIEGETVRLDVVRDALAVLRARAGVDRSEVSDGDLLADVLQRLSHDAGGVGQRSVDCGLVRRRWRRKQTSGRGRLVGREWGLHDVEPEHAPTGERFRIQLTQCEDCRAVRAADAEVTDTTASEAACDAVVVTRDGRVARNVAPAKRRAVMARDKHRCRIPGCRNHLWLDVHHIRARAHGGSHQIDNIVTLCGVHHRLLHDGRLAVEVVDGILVVGFADGRVVREPLDPHVGRRRERTKGPLPSVEARAEDGGARGEVRQQ